MTSDRNATYCYHSAAAVFCKCDKCVSISASAITTECMNMQLFDKNKNSRICIGDSLRYTSVSHSFYCDAQQ